MIWRFAVVLFVLQFVVAIQTEHVSTVEDLDASSDLHGDYTKTCVLSEGIAHDSLWDGSCDSKELGEEQKSGDSEPLVVIERTEQGYHDKGGTVHCPEGKSCELICKGNNACKKLEGGTGHFAKITCDSGTNEDWKPGINYPDSQACAQMKLPDCPEGKSCELICKGYGACHLLEGGTGHYAKITCDGGYRLYNGNGIDKNVCAEMRLPNCPEGKSCEVECKGKGEKVCRNLWARPGAGHYPKITCGHSESREACIEAKLPDCPEGKACELTCGGYMACKLLRQMTGYFPKIICGSGAAHACNKAALPVCPKGKTCELECKGSQACRYCGHLAQLTPLTGHFSKITCEGNRACDIMVMPICPENARCELHCIGPAACDRVSQPPMGSPGSTLDIVGAGSEGDNGDVYGIMSAKIPQPADLPPKMVAFRARGLNGNPGCARCKRNIEDRGYSWPPEESAGKDCGKAAGKDWWYCPSAHKCAKSERECGGSTPIRWGDTLGAEETHRMPTEPLQNAARITVTKVTKWLTGRISFGVNDIKEWKVEIPVRVMDDAGAGYQGFSSMQLGGLRTMAGTMTDVDASQAIFTLPEGARPNYCTRVWSPLVSKENKVVPVIVETCSAGRSELQLPPGATTTGATLSLSSIKFVPFEVLGGVKFQSDWKDTQSHMYYHMLNMGGGTICVLSGTITTTWGATDSQTIGQLDKECTKGYTEGFQFAAVVKLADKQKWIHEGSPVPFQFFLRGEDHSELAISTTLTGLSGTEVSASVDGITLGNADGPEQCDSSTMLGDSSQLGITTGVSAPMDTSISADPVNTFTSADGNAPVNTFTSSADVAPVNTIAGTNGAAPVNTFTSADGVAPVNTFTSSADVAPVNTIASTNGAAPVNTFTSADGNAPVNTIANAADAAPATPTASSSAPPAEQQKDVLVQKLENLMSPSDQPKEAHAQAKQQQPEAKPLTPTPNHAPEMKEVKSKLSHISQTSQSQLSAVKKLKDQVSALEASLTSTPQPLALTSNHAPEMKELKSQLSHEKDKSAEGASTIKELKNHVSALEASLKSASANAAAKSVEQEIKFKELKATLEDGKSKLSHEMTKSAEGASTINGLENQLSALEASLKSTSAKAAAKSVEQEIKITELKSELKTQEQTQGKEPSGSGETDFDGCKVVRNQVNTTQPGFAPKSVLEPTKNVVIMGASIATRTCLLRGVVKFTSIENTATAFLDPNYRDPTTRMPFCFPMATMIFLASVADPGNPDEINRVVALQIEPHGRIVILGKETMDVDVRLDNIMYHPLMKFEFQPPSCAPYCFPPGKDGASDMSMAGCIKYCTPEQYIRQTDGTMKLGKCRCTMMKRLDCFKHESKDPRVLSGELPAPIQCGQFKKLMSTKGEGCDQICAGQLVSF